jgi:hypothetical protein
MQMSRSKSAQIVRGLVAVTGKGSSVFNDKIRGGRSIKVWGWTRDIYLVACEALERQGIPAQLVTTPKAKSSWSSGNSLRIHTQEG